MQGDTIGRVEVCSRCYNQWQKGRQVTQYELRLVEMDRILENDLRVVELRQHIESLNKYIDKLKSTITNLREGYE